MKNAKLLIVAIVLIVVALLLQQSRKPAVTTDPLVGQNLVSPGEIDQTRGLLLKSSQGEVDLKFAGNAWRVANLHNFKADGNKLEELFQRLHDAKFIEAVTGNAARHADLGVVASAPVSDNQDRAQIVLKNSQGGEIKTLILGNGRQAKTVDGGQGWGNDGQYVRLGGSDNVYLLSNFFWLEKIAKNWLSKELLRLPIDRIARISWNYPEAVRENFELARASASESLVLNRLDDDQQTRENTADSAARFFENLNFDEFIATASPELHPGLEDHLALWVESFDGLKLSMRISSGPMELPGMGKMSLVWVTAEYAGADAQLRATADEIASNSRQFVFALRESRVKAIMIKSGNLLEARPKPAPENASDTAAVGGPEKVEASHILLAYKGAERSKAERSEEEAKKLAAELLAKIKAGESFEKIAEENSDCPSGKSKKGSLGEFGRGMMAKEFEETSFSLQPGQISDVVKTAFGYHIIRRDK